MPHKYSIRKYLVVGIEGTEEFKLEVTADDLFSKQETEVMYSLQEEVDKILDLSVGQSIFVNINRDNSEYKGVLMRTS